MAGKGGKVEVFEAIRARRSVRRYQSAPVSDEVLTELLSAAVMAPSAGNAQPWRFIVVRDQRLREGLVSAAYGQSFLAEAPVVIVVCADLERARRTYRERGETLYCLQDTAAAIQNLLLAATAKGLGTCWVGAFDEGKVAELLTLSKNLRPVALIPVGKPAESPQARPRRPLSEVVEYR
ncbi:nitroreductase family protein [Candidatus Bipolaricaulota bacterium]|nr:nitroreductase family protein [Candidatus Bipolaricaulota bacterium]